jgi:CHAT domain-containing protein
LVHFAGHGQVDPTRPGDAALYLSDGTPLDASLFRATPLGEKHAPFMFLNACMVGTAGTMLGDYDGFPGNCLAGNFTGLVAPIWAVNDVIARWIATEFYREALAATPRPVAEILRDLRQQFATHANASSYLAYVYYGNPYLTFS